MNKWDKRFLDLADHIATWSKDPSTKVGAVVVDDENRIVGMGYNGFPRGVRDDEERYKDYEMKYSFVVHAEVNAILNAVKEVRGCRIYISPLFTCNECAKVIIQSGIKEIISSTNRRERYLASELMYKEAGVDIKWVEE